jgi:hypothetical protein
MLALDLHQYKDLVILGLDKQLARLKGGFVLDDFDPAVEGDRILRARLERFVKRKNLDWLDRMLQELIHRFRFKNDLDFASMLFQVTGISIEPVSSQEIPMSTIRNLRIGTSGKENTSLTFVIIELPTGSSSIYCVKGHHPMLTADWLDTETIEINIPGVLEEMERVTTVRMYEETIRIVYNVKD